MDLSSKLTHPIFKGFTQIELDYLFKIAKTATFEKGGTIIHEGDLGQEIYVILDGQVDVSKESGIPGEVIALATLGPGNVLGEIAVITNRPRSATVIAIQKTTVLLLNIAIIKQDINAKSIYEKLLQNLTVELSKKLIYAGNKLIKCDTEDQYEAELVEDKTIHVPGSIVVLFGWKWVDIMYEVPFLVAHGYDAIKIYPPQECVIRRDNPWWTIYQPVSYQLSSFYGTEEEFVRMVDFCHGYNIKVYVDLILNHMADFVENESQHIGTNGHTFNKYSYGPLNNENDRSQTLPTGSW